MVQLLWSLVAAAAAVTAIPSYGSCQASDKCLKAVKASNGYATKDCKAALYKTVTSGKPCTKTVTARVTKTSTVFKTNTNTIVTTSNVVSTFTPIVTETTTTSTTLSPTVMTTEFEKRNERRQPPTYATKSCNAKQYTSACSCIGVKPSTKTVTPAERTVTKTSTVSTVRVTKTRTTSVISITTAVSTATGTPSTTINVVTSTIDPDDTDPTQGVCSISDGVLFNLVTNGGEYLQLNGNGIVATMGERTAFLRDSASGLVTRGRSPSFALKTTDGGDLTYLFGSTDSTGAVLQCSGPETSRARLVCAQGSKTVLYKCPAQEDGTTIAIGNPAAVAAGTVGEGCEVIRFRAETSCQK